MAACACAAQVRYELVPEEELEKQRTQFRNGQLALKIEETTFSMKCALYITPAWTTQCVCGASP